MIEGKKKLICRVDFRYEQVLLVPVPEKCVQRAHQILQGNTLLEAGARKEQIKSGLNVFASHT